MDLSLPSSYSPHENEPYMNKRQLAWFEKKLESRRLELIGEARRRMEGFRETDDERTADILDRSAYESWREQELRVQDRFRRLLRRNAAALRRIAEGEYGYCAATGEEIGIRRLMVVPETPLSLEAQQLSEGGRLTWKESEVR